MQIADDKIVIEENGYIVKTSNWKRTIIQKEIPNIYNNNINDITFDFVYETYLTTNNNEWIVRFSSNDIINNNNIFYRDLDGLILIKIIFVKICQYKVKYIQCQH